MTYKNFDIYNSFISFEGETYIPVINPGGHFNGYYQNHPFRINNCVRY